MALGDNTIIVTRYKKVPKPDFKYPSDHPDHDSDRMLIPMGAEVQRPWPGARMLYLSDSDGWFYVYWVDANLSAPLPTVEQE